MLCKLEGFTYAPSETVWWQHGHSTETDFICVTTQNLSVVQLQALSEEVGEGRSLLVLCSAFRGISAARAAGRWPNLTLKKIPRVVLSRCEWGHDDYSLNVQNLPMLEPEPPQAAPGKKTRKKKSAPVRRRCLGGMNDGEKGHCHCRLSEYLGDSYFNDLAELPDLVLLMDESHRYRASAGVRAINELRPLFGLELTATPFVESSRGPVSFKNVVVDYPLARTLIEQSIGRGLRLPYGKRTGVSAVDRLNMVAHDRFQEIIDEANRGDSPIRLKQVILEAPDKDEGVVSVTVTPSAEGALGLSEPEVTSADGGHYESPARG